LPWEGFEEGTDEKRRKGLVYRKGKIHALPRKFERIRRQRGECEGREAGIADKRGRETVTPWQGKRKGEVNLREKK